MSNENTIRIDSEFIKLEAALKLAGVVMTGGEAKHVIQMGFVRVNGNICTERGKKLRPDDIILFNGQTFTVK
ncbi:MAG: RNA-binding S4 domain-containing protein [Clostridiaceae bacterium]|nr:RNA-binding S4 domain-containing protein [Clostridiaceae bacterium]